MKKFFMLVIFSFIVLTVIYLPKSYAAQIRFADLGVENVNEQLQQILSTDKMRQYLESCGCYNVTVGNVNRASNYDIPSRGLSAWNCPFNMENKMQGQLMFLTDSNGYVFELCVACKNSHSSILAGAAMMWCINVGFLSLTESEATNLEKNWNTWSVNKNRRFVISRETDDNGIYIIYRAYDS